LTAHLAFPGTAFPGCACLALHMPLPRCRIGGTGGVGCSTMTAGRSSRVRVSTTTSGHIRVEEVRYDRACVLGAVRTHGSF
jgi:hypothetical protein